LTPQKSNANVPEVVKVDKVNITEPKKNSEKFNEHFCSLGKKLAEKKLMVLVRPTTALT